MKKMKRISFLVLILVSSLISNCSKSGDSAPTKAIPTESTPEMTAEFTFEESTPTPTKSPRVIAVTIDPTFLPQEKVISEGRFQRTCINVKREMPDYANVDSGFVLYDRSKGIYYIQTLLSDNGVILPNVEPYSIKVSPNRKWIAYLQDTVPHQYNFHLVVQSADRKVQKTFNSETIGDVTGISGWLNDENIALELLSKQPLSTLVVINPFTGSQQKLTPDFPNIYDGGTWEWDSSGLTVYSPDLHYVVYPAHYGDTPPRYIMWDIQNSREIVAILTGDLIQEPQWAENGKLAVVTINKYFPVSSSEFYSANIDGMVVQLSKLEELFPNIGTKVRSWSWSPDSRYIAFWLDFYQKKSVSEERLMILDTETGDIVDYCIQGDEIQIATDQLAYTPPPIWSPNGGSLLIENRYETDQSRLILLELGNNAAYQLAQNVSPLGWMINEP